MGDPFRGWGRVLSHHGPDEAHHCHRFRLGGRDWALCARCLALYPILLAVVALEVRFGRFVTEDRWFFAATLITPAVIDWSRSRLFGAMGANWIRSITGALAGAGLGLSFTDYLKDSNPTWVWVLWGTLAGIIVLVWSRRPPL